MFYSNRLGQITDAQLQDALDRFGLGALVSTSAIPFGLFGQNLYLTSTTGDYVFRGAPHYNWQLPTERFFAERLHRETDVPVPWHYFVETDSDVFPWNWGYAIMPRMPGNALADPVVYDALSDRQRLSVTEAMGAALSKVHEVASPIAGSYDIRTASTRPFASGYVGRTVERARESAANAFANGAHDSADVDWLDHMLDTFSRLREPARYTIVHEDFNRNNMTATIDGGQVEITGLFDLMTCHFGDGLADLPRQFAMHLREPSGDDLARAYINSYVSRREALSRDDVQRALLYLIDERLLVWEYFHRPGHSGSEWEPDESLRHWLGRYLDTLESMLS
jgi:aminoglycoside phosphotransferase (APT) family kinase protein